MRRPLTGCVPVVCAESPAMTNNANSPPKSDHLVAFMSVPLEYQRMTDTLTPTRLWKSLPLEQRERIARAFWLDEEAIDDQLQAALQIAQQKKFRAKTVIGLDVDRKARHLATLGSLPDSIAARALIV